MCQPVIHSLLECVGGSREEVVEGFGGGGHSSLFARAESARTWAAGVAERANQAPGMCTVGERTGGQVEERDEGDERKKKKMKLRVCSAARGSGSWSSCTRIPRPDRQAGRMPSCRQRSGMQPLYLPSFFFFASPAAERLRDTM